MRTEEWSIFPYSVFMTSEDKMTLAPGALNTNKKICTQNVNSLKLSSLLKLFINIYYYINLILVRRI